MAVDVGASPLTGVAALIQAALNFAKFDRGVFAPVDQFYIDNPQEAPQFGAVAPMEDWLSSGILDEPGGSSFVDLPPPQQQPPGQNVPEQPIESGSSETGPPPLPAAILAPLPWGFGGSGSLRPSGKVTSIDSSKRKLARMFGMRLAPKRKTTEKLAEELGKRVAVDSLRKLGVPGALARIGGRFLGPVGMIGTTVLTAPGVFSGVLKAGKAAGDIVADTLGKVPALFGGQVLSPGSGLQPIKVPGSGLQPIKVPGSYKPDSSARGSVIEADIERMRRTVQEARRGVYERTMRKFPAQPQPAGMTNKRRFSQTAASRAQQVGKLLDALKKARAGKSAAALAAIAAPIAAISAPIAPPIGSTLYSPGYRLSTQTATAKKACDCSQCGKKKRGPRRKCLQRAAVAFTGGARAGKHAGTKCVRWEGGKSR